TGAQIKGANFFALAASQLYSTASYLCGDLTGVRLVGDLSGWNFANQNLTGASLHGNPTNANFTRAIVKGADFSSAVGFAASQLYSTASYVNGDLSGIKLSALDLTGWNFTNQNLAGANFDPDSSSLTNANFTGADLRNAFWSPDASTITHNTIQPD